ncbi:MAG: S8 family serine peptidase [Oscillospiraceae bacterium]
MNLLDQDEIAKVLDKLNIMDYPGAEASGLYLSSKIPFAYNYVDMNLVVDHDHDGQGEHGSHVEGIAAANAYIQKDDGTFVSALDEVKVQGVAPDAQIIVMKVFGASGGAYDSDYMAAIEDAIVLGCDSINLSLGSAAPGFTRCDEEYKGILDSLCENGSVVAIAAGNVGYWAEESMNGYLYNGDVNFQTAGSPATFTNSLAVASVDNDGYTGAYFTVNGNPVFYNETIYGNRALRTLSGTNEYVFMDNPGDDGDYWFLPENGEEVEGKVVFVERGSISFSEKANQGFSYNAAAVIVYNNAPGMVNMDLTESVSDIPCVFISKADADMIRKASTPVEYEEGTFYTGEMTITNDIDTVQYHSDYYTMSTFSSWGVTGSLELKPEITAPGGSIYSVDGSKAGGKSYETMSGTSMATPQISGMAALVGQYIRENKLDEKTGKSPRQLINSLLMSTAKPVINGENEMPYSVLQQGAGLANVNDAINAKSFIMVDDNLSGTASDGKVKVELGDDPDRTGKYSFSFSINNLNGQQQEYTFSTELFTQAIRTVEEVEYLDTLTTPIAASVSYDVDGQTFVPTSKIVCDVNRDGVTDEKDAQLVLDSVIGLETLDAEQQKTADVNANGSVTSYDAYLILKGLTIASVDVPVGSKVDVTVNIELTEEAKKTLNETYNTGAYIEGYVYVDTANTPDGERLPAHSIPILGFFGNWSDPSMYDHPTMSESLAGDTRESYFGVNTATNCPIIGYPGDGRQYYISGNPFISNDPNQLARLAVNSSASFKRYNVSLIRNAAAGAFYAVDADGNILYMSSLKTQMEPAYYYFGYADWVNVYDILATSWKPSSSGLVENDTFTAGVVMVPEYYEKDGEIDLEQLESLMASGELGSGAYCKVTLTIDNTAPELLGVEKDEATGDLIVTAKDNQYISALLVNKGTGTKNLASVIPEQTAPGQTTTTTIAMPEYTSEYVTLILADYAGNRTTYKVYYNGKIPDSTGKLFAYTRTNIRGSGPRWMEVDPDTLAYKKPGASGLTTYDNMDYEVAAAEYVGGYVYFATPDAIYAAPQTDLTAVQKVANLSLPEKDMIVDMAFNTKDSKLYAITYTNGSPTSPNYSSTMVGNKTTPLYTIDLVTGEMTQVAEISAVNPNPKFNRDPYRTIKAFTIDDEGNFYGVNHSTTTTGVYLYHWTMDDVKDGKITGLTPINNSSAGAISGCYVGGFSSMTYDHDKDIIYLASGLNGRGYVATNCKLFVLDPETGKGSQPNTTYDGIFYDRVTSLYTVPSNTISIGMDAEIYVTLTESERTILKGASFSVTAEVFPWFVDDKTVSWTSSDESVATVADGKITGVGAGTATITAISNTDKSKTATMQVTVKQLPNIQFSGLVTDANGNSYWADFETDHPESWTSFASSDSYIAGTYHDDQLIVHDGSNVYTIDPDSFEKTEVGAIQPELIWSDSAESPRADDGTLGDMVGLCSNGDYLMQLNLQDNTAIYRQLTVYRSLLGHQMAAIAYIGSGTQRHIYIDSISGQRVDAILPANFYYILTETGKLVKLTIISFDRNTQHYEILVDVGQTDLDLSGVSEVTAGKYASMLYDQETGCLIVSVYTEGNQTKLYAISPDDCLAAYLGTFGEKNCPVVSLYQHERATDLDLKIKPTSVEIYAGDTQKITAKVILGQTDEITWSSSDESVATVSDGVITGVSEGTAVITATTVDTNKNGQHISANVNVTVKPLTKIVGAVSAQITKDGVASWVNLDLSKELEVTVAKEGATQFSSGGLHDGAIYSSNMDLNSSGYGNIYMTDIKTFEETVGTKCHVSNAPRDVTTAPEASFTYTSGSSKLTLNAFGYPLFISNSGATYMIADFMSGSLLGWQTQSVFSGLSAIAYVGDTTVGEVNNILDGDKLTGADDDTKAYVYYVLSDTGMLYEFIIAPSYNTSAKTVVYNLITGTIADIGRHFDRSALSMEYVEVSADSYGLLIADATDCSIYYLDMAKETLSLGKVGHVKDATNLTALYNATADGFVNSAQSAHLLQQMENVQLQTAKTMKASVETKAEAYAFTVVETYVAEKQQNETAETVDEDFAEIPEGTLNAISVNTSQTAKPNAAGGTGDADTHVLTVRVTDTEDVTNGLYTVTYDPAKVSLVSKSSAATLKSFRVDEENGKILFAFASENAISAGSALATLTFSYGDYVNTQITIEAKQRNDASEFTEEPAVIAIEDEVGEHDWQETGHKDAACTENGYTDYYCAKCEKTRHDVLPALGHKFQKDVQTGRYVCKNCGMVLRVPETNPTTPGKTDKNFPFTDVYESDRYYDAVNYLYNKNIMKGTAATLFSPNAELTRAMVVTILYRSQGKPAVSTIGSFKDVAAGCYYTEAVEWGAANNIVRGFADGTFRPDQAVTREQLAAFISRYAEYNGVEIVEANGQLSADAVVSNWAKKDVEWACAEGILTSAQARNATQNATRAEVAMALYTYLTKVAK